MIAHKCVCIGLNRRCLTARLPAILCCTVFLGAVGCNRAERPEMGQVRGTVTLNGAPLAHGSVISYPESGRGARGSIQSDGTFELETYDYGKGAVVGEHRLAVRAYEENPDAKSSPDVEPKLIVPQRYVQSATSGFSVVVEAGKEKQIVLELTE